MQSGELLNEALERGHAFGHTLGTHRSAFVFLTLAVSTQQPAISAAHAQWASIPHPLLVGISGNTLGLICLMIRAGLLRNNRRRFARH